MRKSKELLVRIWGMSTNGRPFIQNTKTIEISATEGLIARVEAPLTVGDVIGVQYLSGKARCRVTSLEDLGVVEKFKVGVKLLEGQKCPWAEELPDEMAPEAPTRQRRSHSRHKIFFNMDLCDERVNTRVKVPATDISANGCYVETMLPLSVGTILRIEFWLDTDKIQTSGVVRTMDPGVGMGIEFSGLSTELQIKFQQYLDGLDVDASRIRRSVPVEEATVLPAP
jgi:hypothetical protein